ncbi:MAG TPA: glutathione S-transferase N-terminal domain-containing protein [Stellaceae bacterium]|jgi:glutathione S-transferase
MKLVLYYAPVTCALAPYITLTEAGADFEVRPVNLRKREHHAPDYLKLNPKHQVPTLMIDGEALTENVAIQQWIARNFPKAKLLPSDPMQELRAISLLSFCASGIHPFLFRINSPHLVCDLPDAEPAVKRLAQMQLFEKYGIVEAMLQGREWLFDHFTAADAHFFWCFRRGSLFPLDQSQFKNCTAHFERMKQRPSVQKLLAFEKEVQAEFAKVA